ncbi:endo-1,3-1,4-beta-D-glucanase [Aspergillus heteromorphus CBS 117.55]|uniref:Endo-1,3-1,4-beta-D-glucanase n=1 Tax=Aspergillus heteromorphus CBS 117.55 TaxID=1448321 RepID=A0A317WV01_9EURO|nr:endo-1,3-1,4-beta-D-glucanase [Aspergillus heteromorphus CBS 117.55]PWY90183.1 endo-1,3-1,4-beta-D-glucanase [Aspergillus heteromorphus CBS 117.55]
MTCDACKTGFRWDGTPVGSETTLAGNQTYVTGTSTSAAILIVHDVFGWTLPNARLLADHYAQEANATVYLPDFFGGEIVSPEVMDDPEKRAAFDIPAFIARNTKEQRFPEILACARALKDAYPKVGAIGFCYGGWAVFQLAAHGTELLSCISTAHPTFLSEAEIAACRTPAQILAPEHDQYLTPELKEYCNRVIPSLGVPYEYVYFPGMSHGFATRANLNNELQKAELARAKRAAVHWFNEWLR